MDRISNTINAIVKSATGKKMLTHISPIYDDAESSLKIFEAIGKEFDEVNIRTNEIQTIVSVSTCPAWALIYYEQQYGIQTNNTIPIEQRRNTVIAEIRGKLPMNPQRMMERLTQLIGYPVSIQENVASNTFRVLISAPSGSVDENKLTAEIRRMKPAHLICTLVYTDVVESVVAAMITHSQMAIKTKIRQV